MGEAGRSEAVAAEDEGPHPEITLREISAWSLAILAAVAAGFVLYAAREIMLPVVAAFVVGRHAGSRGAKTSRGCTFRDPSWRSSWWLASR